MGRTPCCEKMGVKKGPWTVEEDQILISHIQQYGHDNWRALPKQAGVERAADFDGQITCGRISNEEISAGKNKNPSSGYIKFSEIGAWSAIAARLPGRTDNEIKNFWHTHLKKKLEQYLIETPTTMGHFIQIPKCEINNASTSEPENYTTHRRIQSPNNSLQVSPDQFSGELSTSSDPSAAMATMTQPIKEEQLNAASTAWPFSNGFICEPMNGTSSNVNDDVKFWYNLLVKSGESIDLHPKCEQSG